MTCGINLGIRLICFLTLHICCSWALHKGKSSWTDDTNSPVDHGRFEGNSPQDKFRQAYVVRGSSTDAGANWGLYGEQYTAPQARQNAYSSVQYYYSSLTKPNVDFSKGTAPPKQVFGQSSSIAGSSVSDSFNQYNGILRTLPGQQGTQRTDRYAPSKPDLPRPMLISHQPSAWKTHNIGKGHKKPDLETGAQLTGFSGNGGFKPLNEFMKQTSGLVRGRKVHRKGGSTQHAFSHSHNPVISKIHERYELPISHHFGLHQSHQVSAYNQKPQLVSLQTGSSLARMPMSQELQSERPGLGQQISPMMVHSIPWSYGGHPIRRLGDDDDDDGEPVDQTTTTEMPKKPATRPPTKTYTFPPRHTETQRPRQPSVHKKSKWMWIRSNQLTGSGVHIRTL